MKNNIIKCMRRNEIPTIVLYTILIEQSGAGLNTCHCAPPRKTVWLRELLHCTTPQCYHLFTHIRAYLLSLVTSWVIIANNFQRSRDMWRALKR